MTEGSPKIKVGFLGGGKIAKAMAEALVRGGVCSPDDICMSARTEESRQAIRAQGYSVGTNDEVAKWAKKSFLFLTVKPRDAVSVVALLRNDPCPCVLVSACPGVPLWKLREEFTRKGFSRVSLVRIMPNVLCALGEGSTCYCEDGLSDELRELLLRLLRAFGIVHSVPEMYFDAYCAVSGSSPAFVCTFIEALIDGAVRCGLPRKLATEAALQSVRGTATLLQSKGIHPALIRDDITTPGGISIAGLMAMEARAFRAAVADAMEAAYERSVKMTTEF